MTFNYLRKTSDSIRIPFLKYKFNTIYLIYFFNLNFYLVPT